MLGLVIAPAVTILKLAVAIRSVGADATVARLIPSVALANNAACSVTRITAMVTVEKRADARAVAGVVLTDNAARAFVKPVALPLD